MHSRQKTKKKFSRKTLNNPVVSSAIDIQQKKSTSDSSLKHFKITITPEGTINKIDSPLNTQIKIKYTSGKTEHVNIPADSKTSFEYSANKEKKSLTSSVNATYIPSIIIDEPSD